MPVTETVSSAEKLLDNLPIPKDLLARLGFTSAQVVRRIAIEQVEVNQGSVKNVEVGTINLGTASIGQIVISDASATLQNSAAFLQNVRSIVELDFTLHWKVDLGWIGSWSGNDNLGSIDIPVDLGNISVPDLDDIQLAIPTVNIPGIAASMAPIKNLNLGNIALEDISLDKTTTPQNGINISGMGLGQVQVANVMLPTVDGGQLAVARATPDEHVVLPSLELENISVPQTSIRDISSGSFNTEAIASAKSIGVDLGVLEITLSVTPTVHLNVGAMSLSDTKLSAMVKKASLNNISVPVDIQSIKAAGVDLGNVEIEKITF